MPGLNLPNFAIRTTRNTLNNRTVKNAHLTLRILSPRMPILKKKF